MERVNQYTFYNIAKTLNDLERFEREGDISTDDFFMPLINAQREIRKLINDDPIPLGVSKASAKALYDYLDEIWTDVYSYTDDGNKRRIRFPDENDKPIAAYKITLCITKIRDFETVFREEMREAATYFVPKRGIYDTPLLVDSAEETFPEEIKEFISEKAKTEWRAAGRCLAFGLLSASGFHIARSVEAVMEDYYLTFTDDNSYDKFSWGDYCKALEELGSLDQTPKPDAKTLAEFKQMKDDYRNPLMHPRVVLNEPEARMLFSNGESIIIAMAKEIKEAKASGVQKEFPEITQKHTNQNNSKASVQQRRRPKSQNQTKPTKA